MGVRTEHIGEHYCRPSRLPGPLAWAGGKQLLAKTLCGFIPPHKTYVEPFAGGAALFWAKMPSKAEVLSDIDCRLAEFYSTVKRVNGLEEIVKYGWQPSRERFNELKRCVSEGLCRLDDPTFKAYAFLYVNKFGYGAKMGYPTYNPGKEDRCTGHELCSVYKINERFGDIKRRLENATVECTDFRDAIRKYDSPSTFFYLDPPYYRTGKSHYMDTSVSPEEIKKAVEGMRGKFLLTYNDHPHVQEVFGDYHVIEVAGKEEMGRYVPATGAKQGPRPFPQLIIMNYPKVIHE